MSTPLESNDSGISARGRLIALLAFAAFGAVSLVITGLRPGPVIGSADFTIEPPFNIPAPPLDTPYMSNANIIAAVVLTITGLVGVVLGVRELRKTVSSLPLMIAVSGAMIVFPEVFFDLMGGVYFPWSESNHAFTIMGREMPWWIVAGWFGYGVFNFFTFKLLMSNPRTRALWLMLAAAAAGDVVFEELLLSSGVYHYYGNQPLVLIFQLPWWWIPCNSVGVFLAAAIAYRYREQLRGWRAISMLAITPMSVGAVYGFIALPSWIAVNGDLPWLPTQLLGLVTIALGIAVFAAILEIVLGRRPFHLDSRPSTAAGGSQPGRSDAVTPASVDR